MQRSEGVSIAWGKQTHFFVVFFSVFFLEKFVFLCFFLFFLPLFVTFFLTLWGGTARGGEASILLSKNAKKQRKMKKIVWRPESPPPLLKHQFTSVSIG